MKGARYLFPMGFDLLDAAECRVIEMNVNTALGAVTEAEAALEAAEAALEAANTALAGVRLDAALRGLQALGITLGETRVHVLLGAFRLLTGKAESYDRLPGLFVVRRVEAAQWPSRRMIYVVSPLKVDGTPSKVERRFDDVVGLEVVP